jgi:hypothetical protein
MSAVWSKSCSAFSAYTLFIPCSVLSIARIHAGSVLFKYAKLYVDETIYKLCQARCTWFVAHELVSKELIAAW